MVKKNKNVVKEFLSLIDLSRKYEEDMYSFNNFDFLYHGYKLKLAVLDLIKEECYTRDLHELYLHFKVNYEDVDDEFTNLLSKFDVSYLNLRVVVFIPKNAKTDIVLVSDLSKYPELDDVDIREDSFDKSALSSLSSGFYICTFCVSFSESDREGDVSGVFTNPVKVNYEKTN
jgi:hypothetical protein